MAPFNPEPSPAAESAELAKVAAEYTDRVTLTEVRLDQGGYTSCGVYFGVGAKLYYMADYDGHREEYFRAAARPEALAYGREVYPQGKFRY